MNLCFSVCMSVYYGDNAEYFRLALDSMYRQNRAPDELVLVVDGPVGNDIETVINEFDVTYDSFRVIRLEKNSGHAIARQTGLEAAHYDYIAIMDSDDIAEPDRFEKQLSYLQTHPNTDALGGQIDEFVGSPDNIVGSRIVPEKDEDIKSYLKRRCPMNLVTVMLRKESVEKVGGYID